MISFLRGSVCVLGLFLASCGLGEILRTGFDQSAWILDLRSVPHLLRVFLLVACGAVLIAAAVISQPPAWLNYLTKAVVVVLTLGLLVQSAQFFLLLNHKSFRPSVPVPLTLLMGLGLAGVLWLLHTQRWNVTWPWAPFVAGALVAIIAIPLSQMFFFGRSDYRRQADAIVVLGARTYPDGRMSDALTDRMRTAVALYKDGLAPCLIVSGGPTEGTIHETDAMRKYAIANGVPKAAIVQDRSGVNTEQTAKFVSEYVREKSLRSVLAVSHAYHLPRVKMALERNGVHAFTVPAAETVTITKMPYLVAREVAALWSYYLIRA